MHVGDDEEMQKHVKILKIKEQESLKIDPNLWTLNAGNDWHEGKRLVEDCNLITESLQCH